MPLRAEWRTTALSDTILIVDDATSIVRSALAATPAELSRFLTTTGDFATWHGAPALAAGDPAAHGHLVLARAQTGEVITMDPEAFWEGIYTHFRSRGVDYDSPFV